jgi:hypothetical protein
MATDRIKSPKIFKARQNSQFDPSCSLCDKVGLLKSFGIVLGKDLQNEKASSSLV